MSLIRANRRSPDILELRDLHAGWTTSFLMPMATEVIPYCQGVERPG